MSISGAPRYAGAVVVCLLLFVLSGCGTFYVDDTLHDLTPAERVTVSEPRPVQLLVDFQTKGVHNAQATAEVQKYVEDTVQKSGLFTQVSATPVSNNAVLNVVLNNVPLTDNAFAKGFMTGFTFGIVGSNVGDGYICTIDYLPGGSAPKISRSMRDAIYLALGATAGTPEHAQKVSSFKAAIETMIRQVVSNTLNEVAKDKAFNAQAETAAK